MQSIALGREIRRVRQNLGLRQRDIATHISVTPGFISQLENGLCPAPSQAKLSLLAGLLQIDQDELFALAGRVPSDVADLVQAQPRLWAAVRHAAQN